LIIVRRMEEKDILRAEELEKDNFSEPWSQKAFRETIHLDYAYYFVAEEGESVIGICGLRDIAGEGEITNVVVDKNYRKQGIAEMLLEKALDEGRMHGIEAFTLEVRAGNEPAIRLYRKLGFESEGIRKNFYEMPKEDALIMWKR
jgi:ribosomal-protein-alanine N-acetyltransferase